MTAPVLFHTVFIDAGPTRSAWVLIEARTDGTIVPVQGGWHGLDDDAWLGGLMEYVWRSGGAVGLEYIDGGLYDRKRWRNLGETMRIEGEVRRCARIRGGRPVTIPFHEMRARHAVDPKTLYCVPASSWRLELCHHARAVDPEIEVVVLYLAGKLVETKPGVQARVIDLPGVNHKNREHLIDAMGGALVLTATMLGVTLKIPPAVRSEQEKARREYLEHLQALRELKKRGIDPRRATMPSGKPVMRAGADEAEVEEQLELVLPAEKSRPARGARRGSAAKGANTRQWKKRQKGAKP